MTDVHRRPFPGWYVVGGAFGVTFVGFGAAYTFSAFLPSLQQTFGASRGELSTMFGVAGFLYFALGSLSGPLADRIGVRPLAVTGMVLLSAGFLLASFASSLSTLLLSYGLGVGLGIGLSYVPAVGAVQRWFVARRGLASGLAVAGIGVGTLILPPLAVAVIHMLGWRHAYLALGLGLAVAGIGSALLLDNDPKRRGWQPLGGDVDHAAAASQPAGLKEAIRSKLFCRLYLGCLISAFAVFVPFVHLAPSAMDRGASAEGAAWLVALIGIGSTTGRFALGGLADRIGRLRFLALTYLGMAASMVLWAISGNFLMLVAFALTFGLFYGAWVAILPPVVMDGFGGANVSGIIGALYTSVAIGTLIGPPLAGYGFDATGSYSAPIIAGIVGNLVAALLTWWSPSRRKHRSDLCQMMR